MSLAGDGHHLAAESLLSSLRRPAQRGRGTQSDVLAAIGVTLAEAVLAATRRQSARVVDLLFPVRHRVAQIGGSNAQRDLFTQLLIDAAIDAGRRSTALSLLRERSIAHAWSGWAAACMARLNSDNEHRGEDCRAL